MDVYELLEKTRTYIFTVGEFDSLVRWSQEREKFLELKGLFPEIKEVEWDRVLPVEEARLRVVMYHSNNLSEITKYIKQNIIKGE